MRRFALVLYLVIAFVVGILLYIGYLEKSRVTITSNYPRVSAKIVNKSYLDKKLNSVGFWDTDAVYLYGNSSVQGVTVKKLHIMLSDKPQNNGNIKMNSYKVPVAYSYGQTYDPQNGVFTLILHVDPTVLEQDSSEFHFTGIFLYSIFDMTHVYSPTQPDKKKQERDIFMSLFYNDIKTGSAKSNIIEFSKK